MNHQDALTLEHAFRKLNGADWERTADSFEHDPTGEIRRGLLEYLLGGSNARVAELVTRLSLSNEFDVTEILDLVDELVSAEVRK